MSELDVTSLRADARRNRAALLVSAGELLAARGLAVQVEDVAAAAGVGVATIYRHFGSRDGLIRAVLAARTADLIAALGQVTNGVAPDEALRRAVVTMVDVMATERGLVDVAIRFRAAEDEPDAAYLELAGITRTLLAAAQCAGAVRADVTPSDLEALVVGTGMLAPDEASRRRLCAVILDGLRAGPAGDRTTD